jgi:putrescine aminotransferase
MSHPLLHPFADPAKPEAEYIKIVRAAGSTVWDADGAAYIDGMASLWYCQVGHGRTEMIEAITAQLTELDAYNLFDPFTHEPAQRVAEQIAERSPHPDGRVFLACSGSEAVDTALKFMRLVHHAGGESGRQIIVRRGRGYHGTNFGGTTVQGIAANREGWGDLMPHVVEIPGDDLEAAATVFQEHGPHIAGLITEPVQGAGGVFPPPEGYLEGLRRLCDASGALLCFDEVICGFGRTGRWFGSQTFGVTPDLTVFAKGVTSGYQPLSGVIVSRHVADRLEGRGEMLRTGYTYSGHPAACAAALKNMEIIEEERLLDRAHHIGRQLSAGLAAMADDELIESHRGVGAVWAAELGRDAGPIRDRLLGAGVIVRPIGSALVICPPLVITDTELGRLLDAIESILAN